MTLTREEMETHLYLNELKDCTVCICTFNNKLKKKIKTAAEQFSEVVIKRETADGEMIAEFPKNLLSLNIKTPKTLSRNSSMSEEQKKAFVERTQRAKGNLS